MTSNHSASLTRNAVDAVGSGARNVVQIVKVTPIFKSNQGVATAARGKRSPPLSRPGVDAVQSATGTARALGAGGRGRRNVESMCVIVDTAGTRCASRACVASDGPLPAATVSSPESPMLHAGEVFISSASWESCGWWRGARAVVTNAASSRSAQRKIAVSVPDQRVRGTGAREMRRTSAWMRDPRRCNRSVQIEVAGHESVSTWL